MSDDKNPGDIFGGPRIKLADNIHYMSGSQEAELPTYVKNALDDQGTIDVVQGIEQPAELVVFSSSGCPHCPLAVKSAVDLARINPGIDVVIVDAQANPELSKRFNVKSVPFTMLDRGLSWVGVVVATEVASRINGRKRDEYEDLVFESMLESGRLDDVSTRLKTSAGISQFSKAWLKSTTSSRIGLMMVCEDMLEQDPNSLNEAVNLILNGTKSDDAAMRGDTADLLGQIGHSSAEQAIAPLLDDPNPDVAEIAEEAIESIQDRKNA